MGEAPVGFSAPSMSEHCTSGHKETMLPNMWSLPLSRQKCSLLGSWKMTFFIPEVAKLCIVNFLCIKLKGCFVIVFRVCGALRGIGGDGAGRPFCYSHFKL